MGQREKIGIPIYLIDLRVPKEVYLSSMQKPILALLFLLPLLGIAKRPNIIFILTDDQGYGDVNAHGHPYLKTPHTNKLREESVSFDNFYVQSILLPTRAALLSGNA